MNPTQLTHTALWIVPGQTQQRINDVAERFQAGGGADITATHVVVFGICVVILGIVLWRVARIVAMRDGRSYFSTKRLFLDLCRLHELDLPSRRLLQRLADARQLQHPAQLFLEPAAFEASELPSPLRPHRDRLAQIRDRVFHRAGNR